MTIATTRVGHRLWLAAAALCLASTLAACGSQDPTAAPSDATTSGTGTPRPPAATPTPHAAPTAACST